MTDTTRDLTQQEEAALSALRQDAPPSAGLEVSLVEQLGRRGLVRRRRRLSPAAALLTAAALFGLGLFVGSLTARRLPAAAAEGQRYVLFLEGADAPTPEQESARVDEYRTWARREAHAGHLVSGEKLAEGSQALGTPSGGPEGSAAVRGYFVIVARDDAEAMAIARGCPHLLHGGRVVLRRIVPT